MSEQHRRAGKARKEKMTAEQRKRVASAGAIARWAKSDPERRSLPKAAFGAEDRPLQIGAMEIPCYVLEDDRRVLTTSGMLGALSMARGGSMVAGMNRFQLFASRKRIRPHVSSDLYERIANPILFLTPTGGRANGYEATVLVDLCEAVLAARQENPLQAQQENIARQCELIMRGLARVGIVALVDEVTGFQEVRKRDALHQILEAYISPELMPWTRRFPETFYEEMFRLHGWPYDPTSCARPGVVGTFTNKYVYEQLPEGVLDELRARNPQDENGRRKARHHQLLSEGVGNPHLERQIAATTAVMRIADDWPMFKRMFARAFQRKGVQIELIPER